MPGRQHHDGRIVAPRRCDRAEDGQEIIGVVLDRPHVVLVEQERKDLLHHLAVLEHVADAGGSASVVFEHEDSGHRSRGSSRCRRRECRCCCGT